MAIALAWSRSLTDAHEAGLEGSGATGESRNAFTPFVLADEDDDEYVSLLDATQDGGATASSLSPLSSTISSPSLNRSPSAASDRPVYSEAELDQRLEQIKARLMEGPRVEKAAKLNLQSAAVWTEPKTSKMVEAMQQVTEALVWGERHDATLFDLFCEHHMLAAFVTALQIVIPIQVKVQILQTVSILVQNARRTTSFFFLLSGGQLNILFDDPPDLDEEEILTYFVTFLKSLALRLDAASARLCLSASAADGGHAQSSIAAAGYSNEKGPSLHRLPIFECAVKLVGHRDSMVQTAARTALLSLLRIEDPLLQSAAGEAAARQLVPSLAEILKAAHHAVQRPDPGQDCVEDLEDWMGFVGDLLALGNPRMTEAFEVYGLSVDSQGKAVLSPHVLYGRPPNSGVLESLCADGNVSKALASSRLETVLKHYDKKNGLPFPSGIRSPENVAAVLSGLATPLVQQREVRRAVVLCIMTHFSAEELCLDMDTKAGTESLAQLERRLSAALQAGQRNSAATNVLRSAVSAWHKICKEAAHETTEKAVLLQQDACAREGKDIAVDCSQGGRGKRYHVYTYTLIGDEPYEKLATDSMKKAQTSLHYNTMMGRIAVMYDQHTGRSTFKKDKRGNTYILKAIQTAHRENPCLLNSEQNGNA